MGGRSISAVERSHLKLFVSHAGFDKPIVRAIGSQLGALGYRVWIDEDALVPGDRILSRIEKAVVEADFLVLFLSESALRSTWVDEEWRLKFEQQIGERSTQVIPVLLESVSVLPPVLRGRLYVSGSSAALLREAATQIDHGILELLRRGDSSSESWVRESLVEPATIARMRRELAEVIDDAVWHRIVELLLAARAVATAAYDAGDAWLATSIYSEMLAEVNGDRDFWDACPELLAASDRVQSATSRYLKGIAEKVKSDGAGRAISDRVWSARMVFDSVIEYAQAVALIKDFVVWARRFGSQETDLRISSLFEPLRYAVHRREDRIEPLSSRMLETVCATSLMIAKRVLEKTIEAEQETVDLHLAAILRMCRSPTSPSDEMAVVEPRRTAAEVVADILYLDMMMFRTDAFVFMGGLGEEFDSLMTRGAAAVFDQALTNRGFPRDASYWGDGTLSSALRR